MNQLMGQLAFLLIGALQMLVLLGLGIAVSMPGIDRWSKRFFKAYFLVLMAYIVSGAIDIISYEYPSLASMQTRTIISYLETLFSSFLGPLAAAYVLHCCGENLRYSRLFRLEAALWVIYFIMLNCTPGTTWFYYYSTENQFCRGPLYPLMIAVIGAMQGLILVYVIRWRSRLPKRYYYTFLIGFIPIVLAIFIHFFVSAFTFFAFGIAVCALSMFGIILTDQIEQYLRQQREIAHQRASIMVLQMRPHFIYNTMMSIYYLCKQDPDLAQQVTLDFTTYLRKNFTAIASEELIPFSEELEHTRAYLAVEQAQFDDGLFVSYDTPHIDFHVPPLTLQPIVENAVKHGMDPDSGPLHILIRTNRKNSGNEIIVENSGADFEPANDNEPHIALKNIQQRLEMMCKGEMMIMPRKGGGTIVKVTIPDQPQNAAFPGNSGRNDRHQD